MAVAMKTQGTTLTPSDVADRVADYVADGTEPREAAVKVLADLKSENLADQLLDLCGERLVYDLWRRSNIQHRSEAMHEVREAVNVSGLPTGHDETIVQLKRAESLLEALYKVGERWVTVGDMDKRLCKTMAEDYRRDAVDFATKQKYFERLGNGLNKTERVRDKFDEPKLRTLLKLCQTDK